MTTNLNSNNTIIGGNTMEVINWEQHYKDNKLEINKKLNDCNTTVELYEYFYDISKFYGPDIIFDHHEDLVFNFFGVYNNDYSPYVEYSNFIGYNG